jgi:hypothetical protein
MGGKGGEGDLDEDIQFAWLIHFSFLRVVRSCLVSVLFFDLHPIATCHFSCFHLTCTRFFLFFLTPCFCFFCLFLHTPHSPAADTCPNIHCFQRIYTFIDSPPTSVRTPTHPFTHSLTHQPHDPRNDDKFSMG